MEEMKIKVLLVNGSPRPNHNTGKALKAAMEGIIEAGVELINLYTIKNLNDCYSFFHWQRKDLDQKKKEIPGTCTSSLLHFDPNCQNELPPLLIFITNQEVINFKWSITMQN